jgi:tripartite ATP-independent transporter DctP family solute receptor
MGLIAAAAFGLMLTVGAQAQISEHTMRFATVNPADHPISQGMIKFAELVQAKSGGKITVKTFPGAVLGGDVQVLSAVQGGTIEFTSMNTGILQSQIKEFAVVDFPYLFNNNAEVDALMDGPFGKFLADKLPAKGLIGLGYFDLGFRNVTNSKRPITKLEDLSGLKLRVLQSPIYVDTFAALKANPVPMAFGEVYTALEQKTIDGQENPFTVIASNKLNEVQKYVSATRHIYNPQSVLMSKKAWDKLSKQEQDIIVAAAKEAVAYQRKVSRDAEAGAIAIIKKTSEVNELAPAEINRIRAAVKPVIDKYSKDVGAETMNLLNAEIAKVRK